MAEVTDGTGHKAAHRIPIKESYEGRHGVTYEAVKSNYREPKNLQEAFQVVLELLDILFTNKELHQNENKSKRIRQQLKNQTVAVSVLGRHGVGKSTLLDSLLKDRILPTHRKNNTAVMITIQHNPDLENGPILLDVDKKIVASGKEEISKYISSENDAVRSKNRSCEDLYLQLDCPILKNKEGEPKPVLVDTPGFGEAGGALIDKIASESLEGCSACLLVMSYTVLRDRGDMSILQQLHSSDPDLSNGRRIVIAVTQHDHYYTGKQDEELNAEVARDHVHEGLLEIGYQVPKEQIVLVSGEWALMARELANNPSDKALFQRARKFLTFYKDVQAKGHEDYDAFEDVARMDKTAIAKELEEASNIKDLEARVVEMSSRCNEILLSSSKNKVGYYLQQALDELKIHLDTACSKYQAEQEEEERIRLCVQELEKQRAAISQTTVAGQENEVYSQLKEKVDRETEVACNKTQRAVRRKLYHLRTQSLGKLRAQVYTTEMYHQDLNRAEEDLGVVLRNAMHSTLYGRSESRSHRYMQYRVPYSFHRMEGVARGLNGASDVERMMSTPEPEPIDVDDPVEEESEEDDELEMSASVNTLNGGEGEREEAGGGLEEEGDDMTDEILQEMQQEPVQDELDAARQDTAHSGNEASNGIRKTDSVDALMGSNVNIVEMVGEKEGQLHLKQLVESHKIEIPALRRYSSWKKFKLYMRIVFRRRKTTDPASIGAARRSKYRQVEMTEEEVTQGFQDIMEAYKEEVTFLFYQENSGIRDQVFNYFFSEYRTDVEQKLATFQSKYGQIIDRQDRVLEEADGRMGELAQKVQDLEYITDLMEGLAIFFKTEAMTV